MRLEYYVAVDSALLTTLLHTEIGMTIFNLIVYFCVIFVLLRTPYHRNLRILMVLIVLFFFIGMAARLITVAAILGLIEISGVEEPRALLIVTSYVRMFSFAVVSFSISSLYFERRLATIFLEDYERKQRLYVGFLLSFYIIIGSMVASYLVVFECINWIILLVVTLIQSVWIAYRFDVLEKKNKRKLTHLNRGIISGRYSLSLRFQLGENVRVMRLMRYVFIMLIVVNTFGALVFLGANLPSVREGNQQVHQVLDTIFNIVVNLNGYIVPLTILYVDESYKRILKEMPYLSWVVFWYKVPPEADLGDHGTIYFSSLQMQWNSTERQPPSSKLLHSALLKNEKKSHTEVEIRE